MKHLTFSNCQRIRVLDRPLLRRIVLTVLIELLAERDFQLCIHLVDSVRMARLNHQFLGHSGSTDVITFNYADSTPTTLLCGEIFVSVADALEHGRRFRAPWQSEVIRYMIHGILHLRGLNDLTPAQRRIMKREENRLLRRITRRFALKALARK